jgi:hypothetical protein
VLEPGFPGITFLLETKGIISPARKRHGKEQNGAARLTRGAEGVAGAVLFAANLNTASGGKRGGPLNKTHSLPERPPPLNSILEMARPEAFLAHIALRERDGKRDLTLGMIRKVGTGFPKRSCSNKKIERDDYSKKVITL